MSILIENRITATNFSKHIFILAHLSGFLPFPKSEGDIGVRKGNKLKIYQY